VREFASLSAPDKFQNEGPSWSPDGKTILATATRHGLNAGVFAIDATTAAATPIGGDWGFIRNVQWLPDGRSFLIDAIDLSGLGVNQQIWRVSYPSGERARITNDLNSYNGVSVSADGHSIATAQTEITAGIDVAPLKGGDWTPVTGGTRRPDGIGGMTWLADGRIAFSSMVSGLPQLRIVDADGRNERQVGAVNGAVGWPFATADGRWIYFQVSGKEGLCIFRIAPDGSGLQQITTRGDELNPVVSPDGRTIYVTRMRSGTPLPFKVPAEGGDPIPLGDAFFRAISISPDGTQLLGQSWDFSNRRPAVGLLPVGGGAVQLLPGMPPFVRFTPDGRSLVYPDPSKRPITLWIKSFAGGAPRQIGKPIQDRVFNAAVSRDGRIAISHGTRTSDLVLITLASAKRR
jgi:Tol biopolymer transport system component